MCGRYNIVTDTDALIDAFDVVSNELGSGPGEIRQYNVPPTSVVPVIRNRSGRRTLCTAYWGLLPHWAKDKKLAFKTFNARSETITDKPSFKDPIRRSRCIVPASGWFEWRQEGDVKQPYYFETSQLIEFAGVSAYHPTFDVLSCSIITTDANRSAADIHPRMPVMLHQHDINKWMSAETDMHYVLSLLKPYTENDLSITKVSTKVNNTRYTDPDCVEEVP